MDFKKNLCISKREYTRFAFYAEYIFNNLLYKFIPVAVLLVVLFGLSVFYYKKLDFAVVIAALIIGAPAVIAVIFSRSVSKEYETYYSNELCYEFSKLGLSMTVLNENLFVKWEDIDHTVESKDCLYIYVNQFIVVYLPKRFFTYEQIESIILQIEGKS